MDPTLFLVGGVALIVAAASFSRRTGIASPLILLALGIGIGYIPGAPAVRLDPEWILAGVLPLLLYAAAVNVPVMDFRRNLKAIAGLSVTLVVITTLGVGFLLNWLIPSLGLPASIALGAVISPTDAVAATSIGKRLGLPERLVTVLEGESLVNDASALVLLRSAIAAMAGAVSLWEVAGQFVYSVAVAIVIGYVVGHLTVWVRARLDDPVLTTTVSFIVPFVAFLPAERLDASGVLAVVVAGLVTGHRSASAFGVSQRLNDRINWRTIQFLLEHGVFLLMGLELRSLIEEVGRSRVMLADLPVGLLLVLTIVAIRFAFVLPQTALLRRDERRAQAGKPRLDAFQARLQSMDPKSAREERRKAFAQQHVAQRAADLRFFGKAGWSWRGSIILSWAGMRGVVTLAAAQSLPAETPHRALLILIAFTVAVITLGGLGGSLPWLIRRVKVPSDDADEYRAELAALLDDIGAAARAVLDDAEQTSIDGVVIDPEIVAEVRARQLRAERAELGPGLANGSGNSTDPDDTDPEDYGRPDAHTQLRILERRVWDAARDQLLDARAVGGYSSKAIADVQRIVDVESSRFDRLDGE